MIIEKTARSIGELVSRVDEISSSFKARFELPEDIWFRGQSAAKWELSPHLGARGAQPECDRARRRGDRRSWREAVGTLPAGCVVGAADAKKCESDCHHARPSKCTYRRATRDVHGPRTPSPCPGCAGQKRSEDQAWMCRRFLFHGGQRWQRRRRAAEREAR
jgi:hypothetical protein